MLSSARLVEQTCADARVNDEASHRPTIVRWPCQKYQFITSLKAGMIAIQIASRVFQCGPCGALRNGASKACNAPEEGAGMKNLRISVLIVDDYQPWRRFACTSIEKQFAFAAVTEACDGLEAVEKARRSQPDLIVLDIGLPKLNGIEAARQIFEHSSKSKILFCSEDRSCEVVQEAVRIGGTGYIVKSSAAEELRPAIQAVLRGERYFSSCLAHMDLQMVGPPTASTREDPREDWTTPLKETVNSLMRRFQPLRHKLVPFRLEIWVGVLAFLVGVFFGHILTRSSSTSQQTGLAISSPSSPSTSRASVNRVAAQPARSLKKREKTLKRQKMRLSTELGSAMRQIHNLRVSIKQDRSQFTQMKTNLRQEQGAREAMEAKLQQILDKESSVEAEIVAGRYRIAELEQKLSLEATSPEKDRQLTALSSRLEVRDLITARNLHIVDVVNIEGSQNRKPFGRVFFAQGKPLIFYAYDLSSARANQKFYVWGYREGSPNSTRSLGIFREDNEVDKRWVFKLDDTEILADIDSVCVTSEPMGMPHDEPKGKMLLNAYLGPLLTHP